MPEEVKIDSNTEIDQALKEFEAKSSAEDMQNAPEIPKIPEVPKMVGWVMKLSGGAIKEQRQAEYVLFGVVVLMFAVSLFLFFSNNRSGAKPLPYEATYKP
ncbi:hypothetical protein A3H53_04380 [Candidatus Nomurabacteria bacterium RIFCSPLOWO2_02_FULL_40_10]|uniref:Uncharacterized protein n=2 Tax=Candidatus Nomuraibacteriota TaxID=1752729 RepID=A0A1F6XX98_9BACT|nr:MAG: hypothetical protein A2642_03885 [Candidatus Nomurabacteria bacterium RIFCSPHIGHO2_01_FULL_39_10]OGI98734.1 MAG: hypothetical protein A3H53_04380 [Candidatus Nomurabacteria bacterium RIFCSPLOWO2_02_FULL_40_10]